MLKVCATDGALASVVHRGFWEASLFSWNSVIILGMGRACSGEVVASWTIALVNFDRFAHTAAQGLASIFQSRKPSKPKSGVYSLGSIRMTSSVACIISLQIARPRAK